MDTAHRHARRPAPDRSAAAVVRDDGFVREFRMPKACDCRSFRPTPAAGEARADLLQKDGMQL